MTFPSPVGDIGLGVCFDLHFEEPLVNLVTKKSVKMVILPSLWMNRIPFLGMYEFAEAWAVRMQTYLLVANIHLPSNALTGSGVFGPNGVLNYTYIPDPSSKGQLVIAEIASLPPGK